MNLYSKKVVLSLFLIIGILTSTIIYLICKDIEFSNDERFSIEKKLLSPEIYNGEIKNKNLYTMNYAPLKEVLKTNFEKNNWTISLFMQDLNSGASIGIDEYQKFNPASLNKIFLSIILMSEVEAGIIKPDQKVKLIKNSNYGELYKTNETAIRFDSLFENMLKYSDNTAFYSLLPLVKDNYANRILEYLDLNEKNGDINEFRLTPRTMYNIYQSLYYSTILKKENSEYILNLLLNSEPKIKSLVNLPPDVYIAHKTGEIYHNSSQEYRDCGIIYREENRIFYCIMIHDLEREKSKILSADIIKEIFLYQSLRERDYNKNYRFICEPECRKVIFNETNFN